MKENSSDKTILECNVEESYFCLVIRHEMLHQEKASPSFIISIKIINLFSEFRIEETNYLSETVVNNEVLHSTKI